MKIKTENIKKYSFSLKSISKNLVKKELLFKIYILFLKKVFSCIFILSFSDK